MSWSWSGIGKPSAVKRALATYGESLTGMSREEFDQAQVGLNALLDGNTDDHAVSLEASGHGHKVDGVLQHATSQASIKSVGRLVE